MPKNILTPEETKALKGALPIIKFSKPGEKSASVFGFNDAQREAFPKFPDFKSSGGKAQQANYRTISIVGGGKVTKAMILFGHETFAAVTGSGSLSEADKTVTVKMPEALRLDVFEVGLHPGFFTTMTLSEFNNGVKGVKEGAVKLAKEIAAEKRAAQKKIAKTGK